MEAKQCAKHEYYEGYYGWRCKHCDLFYPFGGAPWDYLTPEEEDAIAREEYYYTHGYCSTCGAEYGDGWSNCTCNLDDD